MVTLCQETRVNESGDSEIKDSFQIVLNQGFAGARKAKPCTVRKCAGYMDTSNPMGHQKPGFLDGCTNGPGHPDPVGALVQCGAVPTGFAGAVVCRAHWVRGVRVSALGAGMLGCPRVGGARGGGRASGVDGPAT